MASKTFTSGTVIDSAWLNDVNAAVYSPPANITPTSVNKVTVTPVATGSTLTIPDGATATVSGTNTGDQLTFKTISVSGQPDVVADTTSDTLTVVAGTGITLTTDATTDTLTIAAATTTGTMVLLGTATVSAAVANVDFLNSFSDTYPLYRIEIEGIRPSATDSLGLRFAVLGTVDTAAHYSNVRPSGTALSVTQTSTVIDSGLVSANFSTYSIDVRAARASGSTQVSVGVRGLTGGATSALTPIIGEAAYQPTGLTSGFRLFMTGGSNISAGTIRVYGIKGA